MNNPKGKNGPEGRFLVNFILYFLFYFPESLPYLKIFCGEFENKLITL